MSSRAILWSQFISSTCPFRQRQKDYFLKDVTIYAGGRDRCELSDRAGASLADPEGLG